MSQDGDLKALLRDLADMTGRELVDSLPDSTFKRTLLGIIDNGEENARCKREKVAGQTIVVEVREVKGGEGKP